MPVGAIVGCEDRLDADGSVDNVGTDIEDDENVNEVDTDVDIDVNAVVGDVEPVRLTEEGRDECGGALELPLWLVALALDP